MSTAPPAGRRTIQVYVRDSPAGRRSIFSTGRPESTNSGGSGVPFAPSTRRTMTGGTTPVMRPISVVVAMVPVFEMRISIFASPSASGVHFGALASMTGRLAASAERNGAVRAPSSRACTMVGLSRRKGAKPPISHAP